MTDTVRVQQMLEEATGILSARSQRAPEQKTRDEAAALLADAMGVDRTTLLEEPERTLPPETAAVVREQAVRRADGEPMAYVLGWCTFRGLRIAVDRRAVIPREHPTRLLVEIASALPEGSSVVDVGTGCGAIALAIAYERPDLEVSASDLSPEALEVARANANRLDLDLNLVLADGVPPADHDLIVANPPYARDDELTTLDSEVADFQPHLALVGGSEGYEVMRSIITTASRGSRLALEHSASQAKVVQTLLNDSQTYLDPHTDDQVTVGYIP